MRAEHVAWVTGQDSPNRTVDAAAVRGTDLGVCWDDGRGGVLVAFGDSYGAGPPGSDWRWNVLARSTDADLAGGMRLASWVTDRPGHAREILPREPWWRVREHTVIPTAGITVGGTHHLAYMSVRRWGTPGRWRTNHAGLAWSEDGERWHRPRSARWDNADGGHPRQMWAFARGGDHVHAFGTPNGRFGDATLARVPADAMVDPAAYEHWTGDRWSADAARAAVVLPAPVSELSLLFHEPSGRWLAAYLHEQRAAVVVCTADRLTGPWSEPEPVATGARWPGLYAPYFHPWSARLATPYFLMSRWEPYNVMLMRLHLDG